MTLPIEAQTVPLEPNSDGVIRVAGTRVTLDTVVSSFQSGATAEEIAQDYPSLDLGEVYAVVAYYLRNRAAVDDYLHQRQQSAGSIHQENVTRFAAVGLRERLLARVQR